jgi:hypothetical protein
MRFFRVFAMTCLVLGLPGLDSSFGQFPHLPKFPGSSSGHKDDSRGRRRHDDTSSVNPPGVPIPPDSPIFQAFQKLQQQKVYHQRMTFTAADPQMQQIMAQMGFMPAETITAGNVKQVSMHFSLPFNGQPEDFELRSVSSNGRMAKKWISPAKDRILAEQDAQITSELAQYEAQAAPSIARNLASGPIGMVAAGIEGAAAAASVAEAGAARKKAHDFWEWSCMDGGSKVSHSDSAQGQPAPPPLTDQKILGDDNIDGVPVTVYEFYVHDNGQYHGPMQMYVTKDSGLPMRIAMNDPRGGGGMKMDYYGFDQGGDFEVPACLAQH